MAKLGFRKFDDMIGRVDLIEMDEAVEHWKARGLDFSSILYNPRDAGACRPPPADLRRITGSMKRSTTS